MAFTGVFSVSQSSDVTSLIITDDSSYSSEGQGTFSGRKIYLIKVDGTTLVPDGVTTSYISWPFTDGNIKVITGVLNTDYSLLINVVWDSTAPQPGSTYSVQDIKTFLNYLKLFRSGQISNLSDSPSILQDTNWYNDMQKLQVEINCAEESSADGQQFSAQSAIDRGIYLTQNSLYFF